MTAKQAIVWDLYASGHRVTDIARATGRSKSTVSTMINTIKKNLQRPVEEKLDSIPCIYSNSCFTCPLHDCGIDSTRAGRFNILPGDTERRI